MVCKQLGFYAMDAFTERYMKFVYDAHKHMHKCDIMCSCYNYAKCYEEIHCEVLNKL